MRHWKIRFQKMTFLQTDLWFCKNKVTNCLFGCLFWDFRQFVLQRLPVSIQILHVEVIWILWKHFRAILKKVRHFFLTHFINVKGRKANTSGKLLFGYIRVIRANFRRQIQYVPCVTCEIRLISTKHCLL